MTDSDTAADGAADTVADTAAMARRLAELTERVTRLEDRQEIIDLMSSYGPAIDAGCEEAVARVWTEDGVYDVDTGLMQGHAEITAMVRGDDHQRLIAGGCAHVLEPGSVLVDGDSAVATCKSLLILNRPHRNGFAVLRATANRWDMVKTNGQWKCRRRTSRVLDGGSEATDLLAAGVPGSGVTLGGSTGYDSTTDDEEARR